MTDGGTEFNERLGSRLRTRRYRMKMSLAGLGARLGLSGEQVRNYESGKTGITADRLLQLAHILDVPVDYFFEQEGVPAPGKESLAFASDLEHMPREVRVAVRHLVRTVEKQLAGPPEDH